MMSRERIPRRSMRNNASTLASQSSSFCCVTPATASDPPPAALLVARSTAAWLDVPGSVMPMASKTAAMVEAVNMAPQAPDVPMQCFSMNETSSMSISPAANEPCASYAAPALSSCPPNWPSKAGHAPCVSPGSRPPP